MLSFVRSWGRCGLKSRRRESKRLLTSGGRKSGWLFRGRVKKTGYRHLWLEARHDWGRACWSRLCDRFVKLLKLPSAAFEQ